MNSAPVSAFLAHKEISPYVELGAYEWLWLNRVDSSGALADLFRGHSASLPSDLVSESAALSTAREALSRLSRAGPGKLGIRVHCAGEYPVRLRGASDTPILLYYQGWWDLVNAARSVAVVGTRAITNDGIRRTRKLVSYLVRHDCVILSGLTRGVDALAHETALECGGATIAVAATPISECARDADWKLQRRIASEFLLVSHVPVLRYGTLDRRQVGAFCAERSRTMSALAGASVIVEAGEISGTLIQAQAALKQGRKLFILNSCFEQPGLTWPARLEASGAIRVRDYEQILDAVCI